MSGIDLKTVGTFVGGLLLGSAGFKVLASDDAKKVYTNCTAAGLRAKDSVMKTVSAVQENIEDILAEAEQINEERAAAKEEKEGAAEKADVKKADE